MSSVVVVGVQWGDEGKGKIVDLLAEEASMAVRYQGGANAGHTLVINGEKTVLHLVPSAMTRSGMMCVCTGYEVLDLPILVRELALARQCGSHVIIDPRASVILPIHKEIDEGRENSLGDKKVGTTKSGIGPCYEDFGRRGVQIGDLRDARLLKQRLLRGNYYAERCATARMHGIEPSQSSVEDCIEYLMQFASQAVPHLGDTAQLIDEYAKEGLVIFEGAQAVMLDQLNGTQPYVTKSFCMPQAALMQCGVQAFDRTIGIMKAYLTRVGAGPMPTELTNKKGEDLQEGGSEFGSKTGRPRRCGWLDLRQARYACNLANITELAVTKLDVLSGMGELKVCVDYRYRTTGKIVPRSVSISTELMESVDPVYVPLPGWTEDITGVRDLRELPDAAREYLYLIETELGIPVTLVANGPDREQIIRILRAA